MVISTAVTVRASKKADRKAPLKQNINDRTVFDFTLSRIFVKTNNSISLMKYIPATINISNKITWRLADTSM